MPSAKSPLAAPPRGRISIRIIFIAICLLTPFPALAQNDAPPTQAPPAAVDHWRDMRFGIFIHWGPWSQTGEGSIWKIAHESDPQKRQEYFELPKTFNPVHFDADQWAAMAKRAGAKYVVFTAKHHDGFCNFDTATTDFRITNPAYPYHAAAHPDITGEITRAFRAAGLGVGIYFSNLDGHYPGNGFTDTGGLLPSFPLQSPAAWSGFVEFDRRQVRELLSHYGKIDILWFDIPWPPAAQSYFTPMLEMMRRLQPKMIVDDRGSGDFADFSTYEQQVPTSQVHGPWESNITISEGGGFWYKGPNAHYKSSADLIRLLADVASKDGNLLLNIGPRPDGTWVPEERQRLSDLGDWLSENGPAIYGTRGSLADPAPPWGRITHHGRQTYLIIFDWPKPGEPLKLAVQGKIAKATLLKSGAAVPFKISSDGSTVELTLPANAPNSVASVVVLDSPQ